MELARVWKTTNFENSDEATLGTANAQYGKIQPRSTEVQWALLPVVAHKHISEESEDHIHHLEGLEAQEWW